MTTVGFVDPNVTPGGTYVYSVDAVDSAGASAKSAPVSVSVPVPPPNPPAGLTATKTTAQEVDLKWKAVAGAVGYPLYRNGLQIGSVAAPGLAYADTGVAANTKYQYQVAVTTAAGTSALSAPLTVTTPDAVPAAPVGFAATAITGTTLTLEWDATADTTGYQVFMDGNPLGGVVTGTSVPITGLTPNTGYGFGVWAINPIGHSVKSMINVKTAAAPGPPPVPTGLAPSAITATGVTLACNPAAGATGYIFSISGTDLPVSTNPTVVTTGLTAAHAYTAAVRASNAAGQSAKSAQISFKTLAS